MGRRLSAWARAPLAALWRLAHLLWAACLVASALYAAAEKRLRRRRDEKGAREEEGAPPRHVCVVVHAGAKASLEALARLLVWSLAKRVRHFTYYDSDGTLSPRERELFALVERLKPCDAPGEINWALRPPIAGYRNGTNHRIAVRTLRRGDGRARIAREIKSLCADPGALPSDVSVELLESRLVDEASGEPDLVVYFGELCSARGLLPWHTRLSEFMRIDADPTREDFAELMRRYGRCERRFGK